MLTRFIRRWKRVLEDHVQFGIEKKAGVIFGFSFAIRTSKPMWERREKL